MPAIDLKCNDDFNINDPIEAIGGERPAFRRPADRDPDAANVGFRAAARFPPVLVAALVHNAGMSALRPAAARP
jgi:hypothetical protein